jgi:poly(A) polymerase
MQKHALSIVETLREHGFTALFAGGCVRDMLMDKEPGDYDIVTDAAPQDVMRLFRRTVPVGVQFGIVIVVINGRKYEVAQFRSAGGTDDPLREDALHRDFTINGMFYDPVTEEVFDYVGGQQDIARKIIHGIVDPYARIEEDFLRMLRAVRFSAAFDYQIEATTVDAIRRYAPRIAEVSVERIREELLKILTARHPDRGIRHMQDMGLLAHILPEVQKMDGVPQPWAFHPEGDVLTHTLLMLHYMGDGTAPPSPELAMAVLLHDVGKPDTFSQTNRIRFHNHAQVGAEIAEQICLRLKFSTKSTEKIVSLVRQHLKFFDVRQMKKSTLKRFLRQEHIADLLELHRLDCIGSNQDLETYEFCIRKLEEFQQDSMRPRPLVSGKDLIRKGFEPGPIFKQVLEYIEDAQLEGIVSTRPQALKLIDEIRETITED